MAEEEEKSVEEMMAQVQLMELQAKRMQKLVEQRKQERADMEMENVRMERQLKYLAEMAKENEEVEAEYQREQAAKLPFSGRGFTLGAPSESEAAVQPPVGPLKKVEAVSVDPAKPAGNIQVRLSDGAKMVVRLNSHHTVSNIKQEIMARSDLTYRQRQNRTENDFRLSKLASLSSRKDKK